MPRLVFTPCLLLLSCGAAEHASPEGASVNADIVYGLDPVGAPAERVHLWVSVPGCPAAEPVDRARFDLGAVRATLNGRPLATLSTGVRRVTADDGEARWWCEPARFVGWEETVGDALDVAGVVEFEVTGPGGQERWRADGLLPRGAWAGPRVQSGWHVGSPLVLRWEGPWAPDMVRPLGPAGELLVVSVEHAGDRLTLTPRKLGLGTLPGQQPPYATRAMVPPGQYDFLLVDHFLTTLGPRGSLRFDRLSPWSLRVEP